MIDSITDGITKYLMYDLKELRIKSQMDTTIRFGDVEDAFEKARKIGKRYLGIDL